MNSVNNLALQSMLDALRVSGPLEKFASAKLSKLFMRQVRALDKATYRFRPKYRRFLKNEKELEALKEWYAGEKLPKSALDLIERQKEIEPFITKRLNNIDRFTNALTRRAKLVAAPLGHDPDSLARDVQSFGTNGGRLDPKYLLSQ